MKTEFVITNRKGGVLMNLEIKREKAKSLTIPDERCRAFLDIAAKSHTTKDFDFAWNAAIEIAPSFDCDGMHPWNSLIALMEILKARLKYFPDVSRLRDAVSKIPDVIPNDRNGDKAALYLEIAKATNLSLDIELARKKAKKTRWHPERLERLLDVAKFTRKKEDFEVLRWIAGSTEHCHCNCGYARARSLIYLWEITRDSLDIYLASRVANTLDDFWKKEVLIKIKKLFA